MLIAFSVAPSTSDADGGVTQVDADAIVVVRASGLPHRTAAIFTNMRRLGHGQPLAVGAGL